MLYRSGRRDSSTKLTLLVTPDDYVCGADSLTLSTGKYSARLVRVPPPTPSPTSTPS